MTKQEGIFLGITDAQEATIIAMTAEEKDTRKVLQGSPLYGKNKS